MDVELRCGAKVGHKHRHHGHLLLKAAVFQRVHLGHGAQLVAPNKILVELHGEIDMLLFCPILRNAVAHQSAVASWFNAVMHQFVAVGEIHNEGDGVR